MPYLLILCCWSFPVWHQIFLILIRPLEKPSNPISDTPIRWEWYLSDLHAGIWIRILRQGNRGAVRYLGPPAAENVALSMTFLAVMPPNILSSQNVIENVMVIKLFTSNCARDLLLFYTSKFIVFCNFLIIKSTARLGDLYFSIITLFLSSKNFPP
jgi:hypothetical protein